MHAISLTKISEGGNIVKTAKRFYKVQAKKRKQKIQLMQQLEQLSDPTLLDRMVQSKNA